MTCSMYIATLAWCLLSLGLIKRKHRTVHARFMAAGIFLDVGLVLYLQVTREAVQTALAFRLTLLEQIHIGFSSLALLLYFPVFVLGVSLLKQHSNLRRWWHIRLALTAYVFRTAGFLFMFSML